MKNSLCDLNDHLFVCLEGLMNDDLSPAQMKKEIERAKAVNAVASTIIENAGVQIEAMRLAQNLRKVNAELPEMLIPKNTSGRQKLPGIDE